MSVLLVSQACVNLGLRAGAVVFRDVRIADSGSDLRSEIADEVQTIRERIACPAEIRSLPELARLHEIFRSVGVRPRKQPPSVQKLLEFALKRTALPAINNLVDAYNLVSVRSRCSLGAHDLDRIAVPAELRLLRGDETFVPLGGSMEQPVTGGEFGYVDAESRVLCRLDVLQAEFSKVTAEAVNVLLIIEGTTAHGCGRLRKVFADAIAIVQRHCGGNAEIVAFPY